MASGEVVIESMWSPAVALLVAQGQNVRYAAPPEGFRGWCGEPGDLEERRERSGAAPGLLRLHQLVAPRRARGAIMMRQGYYNSVQETSREYVTPDEWDFWIEGKPAATDLPGITGQVGDIKAGTRSATAARSPTAPATTLTWNSYFQEKEYQVAKWNEFHSA